VIAESEAAACTATECEEQKERWRGGRAEERVIVMVSMPILYSLVACNRLNDTLGFSLRTSD